jgi:hypothetical protein
MNVFLDDVRNAPNNSWVVVRNYERCIELLETGKVEHLSLDHDLGGILTGYDVALWIEERVWTGSFYPPIIEIHSANPVGRRNIEAAIASINRALSIKH